MVVFSTHAVLCSQRSAALNSGSDVIYLSGAGVHILLTWRDIASDEEVCWGSYNTFPVYLEAKSDRYYLSSLQVRGESV